MFATDERCVGKFYQTPDNCKRLILPGLEAMSPLAQVQHVCEETARRSCRMWTCREGFRTGAPEGEWLRLRAGAGRYTAPLDPYGETWPIPLAHDEHEIVLVLSEWVEQPDPKLIPILRKLAAWSEIREWFAQLSPADRARNTLGVFHELLGVETDRTESLAQCVLREYGLPPTPRTADSLLFTLGEEDYRHSHRGTPDPAPTRGIEITSFLMRPTATSAVSHWQSASELSQSQWRTVRLEAAAATRARQHAALFYRVVGRRQFSADLRQENRGGSEVGGVSELYKQHDAGEFSDDELKRRVREYRRAQNPQTWTPQKARRSDHTVGEKLRRKKSAL